MKTPSFELPACAACTNIQTVSRPVWRLARHTSARTGKPAYMFLGCKHAALICEPMKLRDDPAEWAEIERKWGQSTQQMFNHRTKSWTPAEADRLKHSMEGRHFLPGTTRELALTEANEPSQMPKRMMDVEPSF